MTNYLHQTAGMTRSNPLLKVSRRLGAQAGEHRYMPGVATAITAILACGVATYGSIASLPPPGPIGTKCPGRCEQVITGPSPYESPCCYQDGQGPSATFKCACMTAPDCQAIGGTQ